MATKSRGPRRPKQPRKPTNRALGGLSKSEQKRLAAAEKRHDKATARVIRDRAKARKAVLRDYNQLVNLGLYSPRKKPRKAETGPILTRGQKRYLARRRRQVSELLDNFVPVAPRGKPARRKAILKEAKRSGLNVRGERLWVAKRAGGGELRSASIAIEDGRPVLLETRSHEKSKIPFATVDELLDQKERLRRSFDRSARKLKKGEHVRFYVEGKYGSTAVFGASAAEFERLYKMLSEYRNNQAQLYAFIARIRIGIQRPGERRNKVKTLRELAAERRGRGVDRRGRSKR